MIIPMLTGKLINLRAVEPADTDQLLSWENDTSIWRVSNTLVPYSRYDIEEYVLNSHRDLFASRQLRLMIDTLPRENNMETIGILDLFDFDPLNLRAGIGILIRKESRIKGYASEALELIIRYAFDLLLLHQLFCYIDATNIPSQRLFEKAGFIRTGTRRDWQNLGDRWIDEYFYQLISSPAK